MQALEISWNMFKAAHEACVARTQTCVLKLLPVSLVCACIYARGACNAAASAS